MNRKQIASISVAFLMLALLATIPPWKYVDGTFIGFAPVFNRPGPQPDSLFTGEVAPEYVEIRIVPSTLASSSDHHSVLTDEQKKQPVVDVRKMLTGGTVIFLVAIVAIFALDDRTRTASQAQSPEVLDKVLRLENSEDDLI